MYFRWELWLMSGAQPSVCSSVPTAGTTQHLLQHIRVLEWGNQKLGRIYLIRPDHEMQLFDLSFLPKATLLLEQGWGCPAWKLRWANVSVLEIHCFWSRHARGSFLIAFLWNRCSVFVLYRQRQTVSCCSRLAQGSGWLSEDNNCC